MNSPRAALVVCAMSVVLALAAGAARPARALDVTSETRADQLDRLGLDKSNAGDCAGAIPILNQGIAADADKTNSNTPTAYFILANCEVQLGELQAAVAAYGSAIALKPDYELAYANRARIRDRLGDDADALVDIDHAFTYATGPLADDPSLYTTRGMIHYALEQPKAAIADLDTAIGLRPTPDAYLDRAIVELASGAIAPARDDASSVLAFLPHDAKAFEVRGVAESKLAAYARAIADLSSSIEYGGASASVYGERAVAYIETGRYTGAKADLDRAIALGPAQPSFYYDRALVEFSTGRYAAALVDADAALAGGDKDPQAYTLRGSIRAQLGDERGAVADFSAAVREDAANPDRYYDRAYSYYRLHDDASALKDLDRSIEGRTTKPAYRLRAIIEDGEGKTSAALADFTRAIGQDPGDAQALMRRGIVEAKMHERAKAIADEKAAMKIAKATGDATTLDEARAQLRDLGG